jgi:hypothetical protein
MTSICIVRGCSNNARRSGRCEALCSECNRPAVDQNRYRTDAWPRARWNLCQLQSMYKAR